MAVHVHTRIYILGRFLVHVVGSRTIVMRASHDRHCTCLSNFSSLPGLLAHALASKGTLDIDMTLRRLRKLLRIFIQHTPLAVRQREHDNFTDILRKLVRMRQQCIPGCFSPRSPSKRPGNEVNTCLVPKKA